MKRNKLIAAILFGVLAVFQIFTISYGLNVNITQMPTAFFVEVAAAVVFTFVCVKLFKTLDKTVNCGEKRAAAALGVIYFIFMAMQVAMLRQLMALAFVQFSQEIAMAPATGIVMLVIKTLLLFAALFFVILNEKETVAVIEFENTVTPEELISIDAVNAITDKLDEAEEI